MSLTSYTEALTRNLAVLLFPHFPLSDGVKIPNDALPKLLHSVDAVVVAESHTCIV